MRVVIITIVILAVFSVGAFMLVRYIGTSCEELLDSIGDLHSSIENNKWEDAKKQFTAFEKELEDTMKKWQLFLEHFEMDAIDIAMARLGQYVDIEQRELSLGEVAELELLIGHIRDK